MTLTVHNMHNIHICIIFTVDTLKMLSIFLSCFLLVNHGLIRIFSADWTLMFAVLHLDLVVCMGS